LTHPKDQKSSKNPAIADICDPLPPLAQGAFRAFALSFPTARAQGIILKSENPISQASLGDN
jgi:hypothetical protein